MDYLFENLGDERFQEFCQSLIIKEFPNTQALPVGQPDGGRDSITYFVGPSNKDFIVFQVKFIRNPLQITDPHKWLTEILIAEAPKIDRLIPRGAVKYVLITNIKGTAHLETGAIDKVHKLLAQKISIPSMCWWRDDLSRRLELNNDLKWSYTELLSGQDLLNSALVDHLNEHKERRGNVIRAYLADQYNLDDQVKFRQVDLKNRLINLFTDVPIRIKKNTAIAKGLQRKLNFFYHKRRVALSGFDEIFINDVADLGAAEFLLSSEVQNNFEKILVEGGPGQGKSTISQYISQIHRIHLLGKKNDFRTLPRHLKNIQVRLPFKIDLRHVAAWIENKNPYPKKLNEESFSKIWQKSLESFLLAHILHHSQLDDFDRNDFIAVCRLSPVLFVFDGFDEIANLGIREEVIDLLNKGLDRIKENSKSIQVIVTSRPAAFIDSIGFAIEEYPHFELTDITPAITKEYVEKWIKASGLDTQEAAEIRRLVEEKLEMPHLKDLAKSPMQLAIFISLLRKKGESLPNKRTALYDNYIELFFDRESEKSSIIRDNRDLIIDIHEYLGWILHSEAELYKNSGTIEINALKDLLKQYLKKEGHKTDIADQLFDVVKERVCALASRVQGTFEFEVQPLREYFCAKYLYKTSPYSPVGKEKAGSKPERFEAISKNYYWQNTVRFFSGCFDKGELPMLIQQLKELQDNELLKFTNYPRILTSQILSDWVFTQYPVLLKDVVKIIINGINIGAILNQDKDRSSNNEQILLPQECGRDELITECFNQLKDFPLSDYSNELIGIIKNNPFNTVELWKDFAISLTGKRLNQWLSYGYKLQVLHLLDDDFILNLLFTEPDHTEFRLQKIINSGRLSIVNTDLKLKEAALKGILENQLVSLTRKNQQYSLHFLSQCFKLSGLVSLINNDEINISYFDFNRRIYDFAQIVSVEKREVDDRFNFNVEDHIDDQILSYKNQIYFILVFDQYAWKNSIGPWDTLVNEGAKLFGNCWIFSIIAVIGAGIQSREDRFEEYDNLNDTTKSLCKRVRSARMKSGNIKYWESELNNEGDLVLKLLIFFVWATPKTILALAEFISVVLSTLNDNDTRKLVRAIRQISRVSTFKSMQQTFIETSITGCNASDIFKYLISFRMSENSRLKFIYEFTDENADKLYDVLDNKLNYLIDVFFNNPNDGSLLKLIKNTYACIENHSLKYDLFHYKNGEFIQIPLEIAEIIMSDCKSYPRIVASMAEKSCTINAVKKATAVGQIAKNNCWFD